MTDAAQPAGDTSFLQAMTTLGAGAISPALSAVSPAVAGATAATGTAVAASKVVSAVAGPITDHLANWALIGIGVVLAVGALLISQKSPTATIVESVTSAAKTAAVSVA